jgi:hypothetical protein
MITTSITLNFRIHPAKYVLDDSRRFLIISPPEYIANSEAGALPGGLQVGRVSV